MDSKTRTRSVLAVTRGMLRWHLLGQRVPLNVMWRLTDRCNSDCSYCTISRRGSRELGTNAVLCLVDQMAAAGTQRIGFVGGEALLRDDFPIILNRVKHHGIYATLVSNGRLVPTHIDTIKRLDYLVLSFDGTEKNHDAARCKGSYAHLLEAFDACRRNGIKVITNTVLNKHNLQDIDFVLATVSRYRFSATFNVLQGPSDDYPSSKDYRKSLRHLLERKEAGAPIVLSKRTIQHLLAWPDYHLSTATTGICFGGALVFNIDSDGSLTACDLQAHIQRDKPNAATLGLQKAMARVSRSACNSCTCAHVMEYNHIYAGKLDVIKGWAALLLRDSAKRGTPTLQCSC